MPSTFISPNVWFVGDSGTQLALEPNGLRKAANDLVVANKYSVDFIGTRAHGAWTDNQHDGFPTGEIADRITLVEDNLGPGKTWTHVRLVCVDVITNNLRAGHGYNSIDTPALLLDLLELIADRAPEARIAVTNALDIDPAVDATGHANALDFNSRVDAQVFDVYDAANPSSPLLRVDQYGAIGAWNGTDYIDQFHLGDTGHQKRTDAWMPVISPILALGPKISTTEWSLTNDSSSIATNTNEGVFALRVDCADMIAGDQYEFFLREKARSGGTQRSQSIGIVTGKQSQPFESLAYHVKRGWDFTAIKRTGVDLALLWNIREL